MDVLIINGAPRSGKDTFIEFLADTGKEVWPYSSIDWIKSKANQLGWDGKKDERGRIFLSELKDAATKYNDAPFNKILEKMNRAYRMGIDIFATNIREPGEIKKLKSYCDNTMINCVTVRVLNTNAEKYAVGIKNTGDTQYKDYNYDYLIDNNSTIEHLRRNTVLFVQWLKNRKGVR